jgi:hypothetical protein
LATVTGSALQAYARLSADAFIPLLVEVYARHSTVSMLTVLCRAGDKH